MLSVCPTSVLCYLITSQKQWHHSNKWQLKVFCVSFVSCFVFSLIPLSLCFPYHFKFSNCSFLWFKGFFKNITTHKEWTPQIHWKPKIFQCGNNASRMSHEFQTAIRYYTAVGFLRSQKIHSIFYPPQFLQIWEAVKQNSRNHPLFIMPYLFIHKYSAQTNRLILTKHKILHYI
jgi:hypothetical protein